MNHRIWRPYSDDILAQLHNLELRLIS